MVLNISFLNTHHYKVRIKGKVEKEWRLSLHLGVVAIENGTFWSPSTMVTLDYVRPRLPYLPTPPLWQDMTQGQVLSGVW